jgi:hypothetical protein
MYSMLLPPPCRPIAAKHLRRVLQQWKALNDLLARELLLLLLLRLLLRIYSRTCMLRWTR